MKFQITMKDPDGPYECIRDAAKESTLTLALSDEEREAVEEKRVESMTTFASKWMKYGEYITVEFDTESGTASVVVTK